MPIKDLSGNKYQGAIELGRKLHIFYSDNEHIFRCELNPVTGEVSGTPAAVFTATNEPSAFLKGFSADSSYCYAVFKCASSKSKDASFEGVVMDKKMNVVTKFAFQLEKLKAYIDNTNCILSPEGLLYIVNGIRVKPAKDDYKPLQYLVTGINKEGKVVTTILENLPTGRVGNLVWKASKNGLYFTGLLSKAEKEGYTAIFSGEFDVRLQKATGMKQAAIGDARYWQKAPGKWLEQVKTNGIDVKAGLVNSFEDEDGSVTLVVQGADIVYSFRGNYNYTDSYGSNLYVIKIKPDHELDWLQLVLLSQREPTEPVYTGAVAIRQNNKDISIFFNDNAKNAGRGPDENISAVQLGGSWNSDNQLTIVTIKENGSLSRSLAVKEMDPDHHLAPHQPLAIYDGELIYTSFQHRSVGKSTYKFGIINAQ